MPVMTACGAGAGTAGICESKACRGQMVLRAVSAVTSTSDEATIDATRARSGVTSPPPSGWTRLERKMTNTRVAGSIQIDVPVNPVWPKEPSGSSSPPLERSEAHDALPISVRMDTIGEKDDEYAGGGIDPDRRTREPRVAEGTERQQFAAVGKIGSTRRSSDLRQDGHDWRER